MVTTRSGKRTHGSSSEVVAKKRVDPSAEHPQFLLLTSQYPVLKMTLQCMDSAQLITYSFSSPQAANAVKRLGLEVELMEIYLAGVLSRNTDPEYEQGVELTFPNDSRKKVLWWFTNSPVPSQPLHQKIAIDGTVIDECFQTSDTLIGCHTTPPRMIDQLKTVEQHFRSIFLIRKTDIKINGREMANYEEYLDPRNSKTCNKLDFFTDFIREEEVARLFASIKPKILQYDVTYFSPKLPEIEVDEVQSACSASFSSVLYGHLLPMNTAVFKLQIVARRLPIISMIIDSWNTRDDQLKCRDRLEVIRVESKFTLYRNGREIQEEFDEDDIVCELEKLPFDGRRRPSHYRRIVDGVTEFDVDVSRGWDVIREDGKVATLYLEDNQTVFWFIVWH